MLHKYIVRFDTELDSQSLDMIVSSSSSDSNTSIEQWETAVRIKKRMDQIKDKRHEPMITLNQTMKSMKEVPDYLNTEFATENESEHARNIVMEKIQEEL